MDELRAAVRELADAPSAEQADLLVEGLARTPPSPEITLFITQTLELAALHEIRDSRGVAVRWRLVDRLLSLGFPHALHVTPEDLDYHRLRSTSSTAPAVTIAVAVVTTLWCFLWGALTLGLGSGWVGRAVFVVILAAFVHALSAIVQSSRASRGLPAPLLPLLGWSFFAGPLITLGVSLLDEHATAPVLILGLPSMLTALLCALTAAKYRPASAFATHAFTAEAAALPAQRQRVH